MTRYSRKPAILALVLSLAAGITALAATGQFRTTVSAPGAIDTLERAIASGRNDAATWTAYATALQQQQQFTHAATAYQRALELHPDFEQVTQLRFNTALCLAQSGDANRFFTFFTHLTATDPKQAVDILDRPEVSSMRADGRWSAAASTARAQAAD
jgi:tetratricopeptide (TPR) repeat protein